MYMQVFVSLHCSGSSKRERRGVHRALGAFIRRGPCCQQKCEFAISQLRILLNVADSSTYDLCHHICDGPPRWSSAELYHSKSLFWIAGYAVISCLLVGLDLFFEVCCVYGTRPSCCLTCEMSSTMPQASCFSNLRSAGGRCCSHCFPVISCVPAHYIFTVYLTSW